MHRLWARGTSSLTGWVECSPRVDRMLTRRRCKRKWGARFRTTTTKALTMHVSQTASLWGLAFRPPQTSTLSMIKKEWPRFCAFRKTRTWPGGSLTSTPSLAALPNSRASLICGSPSATSTRSACASAALRWCATWLRRCTRTTARRTSTAPRGWAGRRRWLWRTCGGWRTSRWRRRTARCSRCGRATRSSSRCAPPRATSWTAACKSSK
mmetsp:Transcript_45606/g.87216  ORF Transcript_45606/g.87216 Transcript_45606/m.87216 type:complete len:210 (+) Transcript_45606:239-868(+)